MQGGNNKPPSPRLPWIQLAREAKKHCGEIRKLQKQLVSGKRVESGLAVHSHTHTMSMETPGCMVKLNIDAHDKLCELYGRNWRQQHAQEGESGDRNRDMRIYALLVRYKAMQVRWVVPSCL